MECSELVEALEQRLQGATIGAVQEALSEHLTQCADCRSYLELAARVERQLVARASLAPEIAEKARAGATTRIRRAHWQAARLKWPAWSMVVVPVFDRLTGGPWVGAFGRERVTTDLLCVGAFAAAFWLLGKGLRRSVQSLELARDDRELFLVYRAQVDRELASVSRRSPLLLGTLLCVAAMVVTAHEWGTGGLGAILFAVGSSLGWAAMVILAARERRAALLREREALS